MSKRKTKEKEKHRALKVFIVFLIILIIALGCIYYVIAQNYDARFLPNTIIAEIDVGGQRADYAEYQLLVDAESYTLTVLEQNDKVETISAEELGIDYTVYNNEATYTNVQDIIDNQNKYMWIFAYFDLMSNNLYNCTRYINQEMMDNAINGLDCFSENESENITEPTDAYIDYIDGLYVIIPDQASDYPDYYQAFDTIYDAIMDGKTEVSIEEFYPQADIKADDESLNNTINQANKYLTSDITFETGYTTVHLDNDTINTFLIFDDDGNVSLDDATIRQWVNDKISGPNYTIGNTRTINTPSSGTITVNGGTYGNWVNVSDTTDLLIEELENSAQETIEPIYRVQEQSYDNGGVGYTYLDVNITEQNVYHIKDNKIVYTAKCVSGTESNSSRATPDGTYYISWKTKDWHMEEYDCDVTYWMPFDDTNGIGLHDASWRSSFGGSIYKSNGSHGCINLSEEDAEYFYYNTDVGIPVIVHR